MCTIGVTSLFIPPVIKSFRPSPSSIPNSERLTMYLYSHKIHAAIRLRFCVRGGWCGVRWQTYSDNRIEINIKKKKKKKKIIIKSILIIPFSHLSYLYETSTAFHSHIAEICSLSIPAPHPHLNGFSSQWNNRRCLFDEQPHNTKLRLGRD